MSLRRAIACLALLATCVVAEAANLAHVAAPLRQCTQVAEEYGAYCDEWRFVESPRYSLVAFGYEDGVSYVIEKRNVFGRYRELLRVDPVLQSPDGSGQHVRGYLGEFEGIVDGDGREPMVLASFEQANGIEDDFDTPEGQLRVPAVLFTGIPQDGDQRIDSLHFQRITLRELRRRSRRAVEPSE